ncbi:uncharacterized protein [Bemisia tabaci]|uniref:uncharacterized protein n=1 Tax=Bemisia tabaci TaxID=7038 RepID=UPI003B27C248
MLLAPVSEIHNPETMEKSYIFHEYQFRVNLLLVSLMSIGQIVSMYYRFQELHPNGKRSGNPDSDHFIPDKMIIFAAFILSSMILALVGVVKTKTNFNRLLSLHKTLCHIDSLLQRPSKRGKFKYIAAFLIFLNATLLAMDYCVWKFTTVERVIFSLCLFSRLMCTTILVQYGDIVLSIRSRFCHINVALHQELANYFRQDIIWIISRRKNLLPARTIARRRVGELFQLFWYTTRCVKLVNEAFGGLIFGMIVMTSFQLIGIPHFLISMFDNTTKLSVEHKLCALCDFLWMCCFCFALSVLVIPPALASTEASICQQSMHFLENLQCRDKNQ